ncbi:hypothetical protein H7J07_05445 [Mycobacterium koreense]|uniref:Uncharacterized protein n=1 Tax=Mycolicibacillus koreensis TaxID=1069220 RepID=A0A7I7SAY5_9MYCO|nr:hypothetical protein [Mycolicibacillus koreensis]MCV7247669.1 hypothetical protein [Mycolicibacillus koreensis]OSC23264.1 hypothetical protein B8W67_19885 [Mycolicibacillus koreensis]BBY54054.1 hypothetical protein MKOR_13050 [Mycolicibacillus koreensis]
MSDEPEISPAMKAVGVAIIAFLIFFVFPDDGRAKLKSMMSSIKGSVTHTKTIDQWTLESQVMAQFRDRPVATEGRGFNPFSTSQDSYFISVDCYGGIEVKKDAQQTCAFTRSVYDERRTDTVQITIVNADADPPWYRGVVTS